MSLTSSTSIPSYGQATNLLQSSAAVAPTTLAGGIPQGVSTGPTVGCSCPNCGTKLPQSIVAQLTQQLTAQLTAQITAQLKAESAGSFNGAIALPPARLDLLGRLSDAQRRVLFWLIAGLTEPQIAEKVKRSRHTVHDHTKAIYAALNVQRRVQLVHLFSGTDPLVILPPEDRASAAASQAIEPRDIAEASRSPISINVAPGYPTSIPITDAIRREALRAG